MSVVNDRCQENNNIFKLLRIARGYSIKELAEELDVTPSYIHAIEKGERRPSQKLYMEYLAALRVDENLINMFNKNSKKYNSYELLLLYLLKLICK